MMRLIETAGLHGLGLGSVDVCLLASVRLTPTRGSGPSTAQAAERLSIKAR